MFNIYIIFLCCKVFDLVCPFSKDLLYTHVMVHKEQLLNCSKVAFCCFLNWLKLHEIFNETKFESKVKQRAIKVYYKSQ